MNSARPASRPAFQSFALAALVLLASGCHSLLTPENGRLVDKIADAQAEVAATDCVYLYRCVIGPGPSLSPGQTCGEILPIAKSPVGFVAPTPCLDLHLARESAEAHIAASIGVAENGSSAPSLREKLGTDIKNMERADAAVRAVK